MTTDFPTNTCKAWPSDWAAAGICASGSANPKTRTRPLICPNVRFLIVLRYPILTLEFLNRTLRPLDHFHQKNRCLWRSLVNMLNPWSGDDGRRPLAHKQLIQTCGTHFRAFLVRSTSQNKLDVSLRAGQLE